MNEEMDGDMANEDQEDEEELLNSDI